MKAPSLPSDEPQRLAELKRLSLLDTPAEERFDRITRLARKALGVPIALVSLVDKDRQWFKSRQGIDVSETPRMVSFCGHAINTDEDVFVVEDATKDDRFHDNPLVTDDPSVRFYAGRPLRTADGYCVGTLCVIDHSPRKFNQEDLDALDDLARYVEMEFRLDELNETEQALRQELSEAERRASIDALTQLWNREMIERVLSSELKRSIRDKIPMTLMIGDLDQFKNINDSHGHPFGDEVLRQAAKRLRLSLRTYDSPGRYGGEEFMIVLPSCDTQSAKRIGERIRKRMTLIPVVHNETSAHITISIGACVVNPTNPLVLGDLVKKTDELLYEAKQKGRNRCVIGSYQD